MEKTAAMQEAKDIAGRCRKNLLQNKQNTLSVLQNPIIEDWLRVDVNSMLTADKICGIGEEVKKALKQFRELAAAIQNRIERVDNEVGSLSVELGLASSDPDKLATMARQTEKSCKALSGQVDSLLSLEQLLTEADAGLREALSLQNFIDAVSLQPESSAGFALGLKILQATVDDPALRKDTVGLRDLFAQAVALTERLRGIEQPENLPPIARSAFTSRIAAVKESLEEIKNYVEYVEAELGNLLASLQQFDENLQDLKKESAAIIVKQLEEKGQQCTNIVSAFQKYSPVLDGMEKIGILLQDIKIFRISLQSQMLHPFFQRITEEGADLHPATWASRQAQGYFRGLGGSIRILRLLLQALLGKTLLSESALEQLLESALMELDPQPGDKKLQEMALAKLCQKLLSPFGSPFPRNDLDRLIRQTITEYSADLDRHLTGLEIAVQPSEDPDSGGISPPDAAQPPICSNFGKLVSGIEVQAANLQDFI